MHAVGNLQHLRDAVARSNGHLRGSTGIGHTRWATHGRVTEANAHPHWDTSERVHIVLNGIVENWTELRDRLLADGANFTSETDAEVVAHLVAQHFDGDLVEAVRRAYNDLRGHYAFVAMSADEPDVLVGARKECPLVVGVGEGEGFIASAIPAFLAETRRVQLVENGEIVAVTPEGTRFIDAAGRPIEREIDEVDWDEDAAEKNGYETFMLKEIHEQADAVAETRGRPRASATSVDLGDIGDLRRRAAQAAPHRDRGLRHLLPRRPGRPLRHRGVGAACTWRSTSPPSSATATRCSTSTTSWWASRSPARRPTRWPPCAWRASAAPRCSA